MEFPYGALVDRLPEGVLPPECWSEFDRLAGLVPVCRKETVGNAPQGVRWSFWPFTFEEYVGDEEPDRLASREGALARNRLIIWKRLTPRAAPREWRAARRAWRVDGFYEMEDGAEYPAHWSHNARRELARWKENYAGTRYAIEDVLFPEFAAAYEKSVVAKKAGRVLLDALARRLASPERAAATALWGVRNSETGALVAGSAALFSPSRQETVRECPFTLPEARAVYAATALMEHWWLAARARGARTLFSTSFWHPGEPNEWKGFSEFKSHFGMTYVAYPPLLWRFERGKMF